MSFDSCIASTSGCECGGWRRGSGVLGGWIDVGVLGGEWTRESVSGKV